MLVRVKQILKGKGIDEETVERTFELIKSSGKYPARMPPAYLAIAIELIERDLRNPGRVHIHISEKPLKHAVSVPSVTFAVLALDWPGLLNSCTGTLHEKGFNVAFCEAIVIEEPDRRVGLVFMEIEAGDTRPLIDAGWKAPEVFKAKAADGKTDLWGVMWKPYDFDPDRVYPFIAFVYPGPQDELVPLTFIGGLDNNAHLAQYGFIVCQFGNRGGSFKRSVEYSEHYRGNLRDYPVEDYRAVIEELAARHDWIDGDRVGIWGGSSGAFAAVTSMLTYPDLYKVCVARSGPHDPGTYHGWWSDRFQGMTRHTLEDSTVRWITEEAPDEEESLHFPEQVTAE